MSNHNYSQYSNKKNNHNKPKVEESVIVLDDLVIDQPEVKMEPETAPVVKPEVKPEVKPVITGTVVNCTKLNVRSNPVIDAEILTVLDANSEVEIDKARSTNEWLKITTAAGIDGFCMRKFVSANM